MSRGRSSLVRSASRALLTLLLLAVVPLAVAPAVSADPVVPESSPSSLASIDHVEKITDRRVRVFVHSPSMRSTVQVEVLLPRDRSVPRPTVYLLDGRSADETGSHWTTEGNAVQFFDDKNVNAVLTIGGSGSYYTDWQRDDPTLGRYKWETFLTRELPPQIDSVYGGDGRNAVVGLSMGAQSAMMLAVRSPRLYRSVASFSGCYTSSDDIGQAQMRTVVGSLGGDADNMFGPPDDPDWKAHDVVAHAEALRGKAIYMAVGSGLPGRYETPDNPELGTAVVLGGPIEAAVDGCTRTMAQRLAQLSIPATVDFRPQGTHTWKYWADDLPKAWPTIGSALGR